MSLWRETPSNKAEERVTEMTDAIFKRTSIRKFDGAPVEPEQLERLLHAGMAAPSAGNQQPWEFFVATDAAIKQQLSEASPYAKCAADAAAVIVVCERKEDLRFPQNAVQDLSACTENILLEATTLGLGAVWLGIYPEADRAQAVADILGTTIDEYEPFALVAVGHPAEDFEPRSSKRMDATRIHWL